MIAMITDLHFGVRGDSKTWHEIMRDFFTGEFILYVAKHDIKTVVILGDVFDKRKSIGVETAALAREVLFDPLESMGVQVHVICGNHDVALRNTNKFNSLEMLFYGLDNVTIYSEPTEVVLPILGKVLMLPWINRENHEQCLHHLETTTAQTVISHLELAGFEYHIGQVSVEGHIDTALLDRFDAVYTGHYHHKSSKGNVHYLGTPYQLTWSDYADPKGFHVIGETKELEFIKSGVETFIKVVYDDVDNLAGVKKFLKEDETEEFRNRYVEVIVNRKESPKTFERFLSKINDMLPVECVVRDQTNRIVEASEDVVFSSDALAFSMQYVDELVETDLSKDVIKRKLVSLYHRANGLEIVE